jgi:hypothetical protein
MHATADTMDVIFFQRCGAARDARRYASAPGSDGLLAAFAPLNAARVDSYPRDPQVASFRRRRFALS